MSKPKYYKPDPKLDLVMERIVDVPKELVWRAWTEPEQLMKWFCPLPWKTTKCDIDLRPGGIFATTMMGPDGKETPHGSSCYLEVVPHERLVWTSALGAGFRPNPDGEAESCGITSFTAIICMEDHPKGCKYTAIALHKTPAESEAHAKMGFHEGWGAAFDQLVALVKTWPAPKKPGKPAGKSASR